MSWSILFLCICVCVTTFAMQVPPKEQPPATFRDDYTYSEALNTFYKEHSAWLLWRDAVKACSLEGAALAVPASEDEMNYMRTFMSTDTASVWLGLHDLFAEMNYVTVENIPATDVYMNYQNHHQKSTARDCVKMTRNGTFQDQNCDYHEKFICKADLGKCGTYDKGYNKYPSMGNYCHKLHTKPETWHDAFKICADEQARLVIINSAEEAKLCADIVNRYPLEGNNITFNKRHIHIGFTELINWGKYFTVDGNTLEEAGFNFWAVNEPNNPQNEVCGSLDTTENGLNDITCSSKAIFICEKKIN